MEHFVIVPVEVDENGECGDCPEIYIRNVYKFCRFNKNIIAGEYRCQACIDADVTDINNPPCLSSDLNMEV